MSKKIVVCLIAVLFVFGGVFNTVQAQSFNLSQLIELFITLGIITSDKAEAARAVVGTPSATTPTVSSIPVAVTQYANSINAGVVVGTVATTSPFVDFKINGFDAVTVSNNTTVKVTWVASSTQASSVRYCVGTGSAFSVQNNSGQWGMGGLLSASGDTNLVISTKSTLPVNLNIGIQCILSNGNSVIDSVPVTITAGIPKTTTQTLIEINYPVGGESFLSNALIPVTVSSANVKGMLYTYLISSTGGIYASRYNDSGNNPYTLINLHLVKDLAADFIKTGKYTLKVCDGPSYMGGTCVTSKVFTITSVDTQSLQSYIQSVTPGAMPLTGGSTITVNGSNLGSMTQLEFYSNGSMRAGLFYPALVISSDGTQAVAKLSGVFVANMDLGRYDIVLSNGSIKTNQLPFIFTAPVVGATSNGISFSSIPSTVTAGTKFNVTVSNTGTKTWGNSHDLGLTTTGGANLQFINLGTTAQYGSKTVTFTAPTTPGTYAIRALEQNVAWFGDSKTITVTSKVTTPTNTQPFVVTYPSSGMTLTPGQTYSLAWRGGYVPEYTVYLIGGQYGSSGSRYLGRAYSRGAGDIGTFDWTVPTDLQAGNNYQISFGAKGTEGGNSQSFTIAAQQTAQPITASLSVNSTCVTPGTNVIATASVSGDGITSKVLEKDTNADGVYGTASSWGSGAGTHSFTTNESASYSGRIDFKLTINGTVKDTKSVTVAQSCGGPVSLSCAGSEPTGTGVSKGYGSYTTGYGTTNWTFTTGTPGACQWTCQSGYGLSGNSCAVIGTVAPTYPTYQSCGGTEPSSSVATKGGSTYQTGYGTTQWTFTAGTPGVCQYSCINGASWNGVTCSIPAANLTNGISVSAPGTVAPGASFNVTVTNTGSKPWSASHDLGLSTSDGSTNLQFINLNGVASGGSRTVTFTAPTTAGSYIIRAVEQGVEWFGGNTGITVSGQGAVNSGTSNTGSAFSGFGMMFDFIKGLVK